MKDTNAENIFQLDGKVPLGKAIPVGLQHVLAMFVANITPIMILANVCGLDHSLTAKLVQNAMIIAGIGTLIQLCPLWKIGSGLPIVMGISFTFLNAAIFVGTTYSYGTIIGCVIVGGLIEGVLGLFAKYWMKIIAPIVAASVVVAIGFSLLTVGANSFAGGQGAADFGSWQNWVVGSTTLICCLLFQIFAKGYLKVISVLFGLVAGYVLAICLGMVDFSVFNDTAIVAAPAVLPFKPEFNLGAIISFVVIFLVSATETIGDSTALAETGLGRPIEKKELSGSLAADGFVSSIAGVFGCTPITSFSQNIGLVAMTKVVNRFTIGTGAIIMIVAGIFPAFGKALTTVPQAVLGGCTIMMFGTIVVAGFQMVGKCGYSQRNTTIVALSLSVGLGFTQLKDMFKIFPKIVQSVFAENCVAVVFVLAIILNLVLPKDREENTSGNKEAGASA
ncbi:MAG: nucleobase:cation symporter-2 family protein [Treponema sp.]|nr:nucleobase:cation symporter-2 family protein [Treponema sp.]